MADIGSNYAISVAVKNLEQIAKLHIALKDIQSFATGKDMKATLRFDTKDEGRITTSLDKLARRKKELEKPLNIRGTSGTSNIAIDTKQLQRVFSDFTTKLSAVLTKYKAPAEPKYLEARRVGESFKGEKGRFISEQEYNARIAQNERLRQRYETSQGPPDFATFNRAVVRFDGAIDKLLKARGGGGDEGGDASPFFGKKAGTNKGILSRVKKDVAEVSGSFGDLELIGPEDFTKSGIFKRMQNALNPLKNLKGEAANKLVQQIRAIELAFKKDLQAITSPDVPIKGRAAELSESFNLFQSEIGRVLGEHVATLNRQRVGGRQNVTQATGQRVAKSIEQINTILAKFTTDLATTFETIQAGLRTLPNQIGALARNNVHAYLTDVDQAINKSTQRTLGLRGGDLYGKPDDRRAINVDEERRRELQAMARQIEAIRRFKKLTPAAQKEFEANLPAEYLPLLQGFRGDKESVLGKLPPSYLKTLEDRINRILNTGQELFRAGSDVPVAALRSEANLAYLYGKRGATSGPGGPGAAGPPLAPPITNLGLVTSRTYDAAKEGTGGGPLTVTALEALRQKIGELNNASLATLITSFNEAAKAAERINTALIPFKDILPSLFPKVAATKATTLATLNTSTGVSKPTKSQLTDLQKEQARLKALQQEFEQKQARVNELDTQIARGAAPTPLISSPFDKGGILGKIQSLLSSSIPSVGGGQSLLLLQKQGERANLSARVQELDTAIKQVEARIASLTALTPALKNAGTGRARIPKLEELFQQYATLKADPNTDPKQLAQLGAVLERKTGQARARAEAQVEAETRRKQAQLGENIVREDAIARKRLLEITIAQGENEKRREAERNAVHAARIAAEKRAANIFSRTLGYGSPSVRESTGFEGFRELLRRRIGQLETAIQRNNLLEQQFSTNAALRLPQGRLEQQRVGSYVQIRDIINETLAVLRGAVRSGTIDKIPEGIVGAGAERYSTNIANVKEQLQILAGLEQKLRTRGTPENTANRALGLLERLKALAADEQLSDRARQIAAQRAVRVEQAINARGLRDIAAQTQEKVEKTSQAALGFANNMAIAQKQTRNFVPFIDSLVTKVRTLGSYVLVGGVLFNLVFKMREFVSTIIAAQAELVRIEQILGRTSAADRGLISNEAFNQARKYGLALKDILNTVKLFAQSGFTLQQSLRLSEAVSQAAVGGGLEPQQAVETAIAVQNLSQGRTSAQDIFGRIAKIERINAVTGQDLSLAIQRVGSLATQLQSTQIGPVDAFDAVIGATTQIVETTRVTGNQAATSLRFILARLAAPDISRKLQDRFNIDLATDETGQTVRPLTDILSDVATRYKDLVGKGQTGEANRLLVTLAGARQVNAAAALLTNFNKAMETAVESAYAFGDIERRTAAQLETLQSQLGRLNNAVVGFINSILERTGILGITKAGLGGIQNVAEFATSGTPQGLLTIAATAGIASLIGRVGNNILRNPEASRTAERISEGVKIRSAVRGITQAPFTTLYQHSLSRAALQGAEAAVTGGIIARTISGVRQSPLLTTIDPNAAVVAQGGATIVGRVLQAFGLIGRVLGPVAILLTVNTGLTILRSVFDSFKKIADFKIPTQKELLTTTDFGKQYQETANTLGITISTLQTSLQEAVNEATAKVTAQGIDVSSIISGQTKDPRFRKAYQDALITATTSRIAEIETLAKEQAGPGADKTAIDQARSNIVLGLFRDTAKLLGGPAEAVNVELKKRIEDFMGGVTEITFERLQSALEKTSFGAGTLANVFDRLPDSLSRNLFKLGDFLANDVFGKLSDRSLLTTRRIVEDENIFRQVFPGAPEDTSVGQRLDLIYGRFYERNPQKRADVAGRLGLGLRAALGIEGAQAELDRQTAVSEANAPGAKYLDFIRTTARKVLTEIDTGSRTTVAGAENLKKILAALFAPDNATKAKLIIDTINSALASIRDRVAEIIGGFAKQLQEIAVVTPRFARAGVAFDAGGERLSAAQSTLRALAGVEGQIRLDLLKEQVRLESTRRAAEQAGVATAGAEALDQVGGEGVGRVVAGVNDLIAAGRAFTVLEQADPEFVQRQKSRIQAIKDSLFAVISDARLFEDIPKDTLRDLAKSFKDLVDTGDISEATLSSLLQVAEDLVTIEQKRLVQHQRELVAIQAENALRKQLLDIRVNSANQELQMAGQIADAYRRGSAVRFELSQVELERSAARTSATLALQGSRRELIQGARRTGGVIDQQQLAKAQADYVNAIQTAEASAAAKQQDIILRRATDYVVSVLTKLNESIDSATGGLVEVLSSYESFTNGQQVKTILQGFANTYLRNQAQNIQQSLFGQNGLLRSPLEKIFEQQAIDSQATQLANTFSAITDYRLTKTFENGADVLYRRIIEALGVQTGPGPTSISSQQSGYISTGIGVIPSSIFGGPQSTAGGFISTGIGVLPTSIFNIGSKTGNIGKSPVSQELLRVAASTGIPIDQLLNGVLIKDPKTNKTNFDSKQLLNNALNLAGTYGGAAIGGAIGGRGVANSYAGEAATLGTALGSAFLPIPVVGGLVGGVVGGLFGGLFGKGDDNKPPPELHSLERIERAQRDTITAIENQTRQLLSLDNRLLNVPASFTVPGYRPLNLSGGGGTVVINVDARGASPGMEANIETAVRRGLRAEGTYTDFRY